MISETQRKAIEARAEAYSVEICGKFNAVVFSDHKAGAIAQAELDAEAVKVLVDALAAITRWGNLEERNFASEALAKYEALKGKA